MIAQIISAIVSILGIIARFTKTKQQRNNEAIGELEEALKKSDTKEIAKWLGKRL